MPGSSRQIITRPEASSPSSSRASGSDHGRDSSPDSEQDIEGITSNKRKQSTTRPLPSSRSGPSFSKYTPPNGMTLSIADDSSNHQSPFEYTHLRSNPKLQIWAVRVPKDLKPSRLTNIVLQVDAKDGIPRGNLQHKSTTYKIVNSDHHQSDENSNGISVSNAAAEMKTGMRLLVPRQGSGDLAFAPVPISRHLVLSPTESIEGLSVTDRPSDSGATIRSQPRHLLKFRNHATGFDTPGIHQAKPLANHLEHTPSIQKEKKRKSAVKETVISPKKKKTKV